ncbi:hypothetical protein J4422_00290 [Candidatus Pacearchaeota archaeon]|nr:hypothetical protein [Candidatus Pacearchaeota archaeon]
MTLFYHGTDVDSAIGIARDGAILSPWDETILRYRGLRIAQTMSYRELQKLALEDASRLYSDHELEHRVKSISLDTRFYIAKGYALGYKEEHFHGGVVLGFEIDEDFLKRICLISYSGHILGAYIPRRLKLDTLKEVHLTPKAKDYKEQIAKEFEVYDPDFFYL